MKYCEDYAALLDAFVDGECTEREAARVRAHLTECPGCRAYVADAFAIRDAFPTVEETAVPEGLADAVCAAVRAQAAPQRKKRPWIRTAVSLAACCAIVAAAGWWLPGMMGGSAESTAAPAEAPAAACGAADSGEEARQKSTAERQTMAAAGPETGAEKNGSAGTDETDCAGIWDGGKAVMSAVPATNGYGGGAQASAETAQDQAGMYRKWAFLTAEEAGGALDGFTGEEMTDPATGQAFTRYELDEADFDAVIAELNAADRVTVDDTQAGSLCSILVTR